jgi:dipeptidyl aminopeptidase/acylaminoacyl peptidase
MRIHKTALVAAMLLSCALSPLARNANAVQSTRAKLTLDEFFNSVSFDALEISPDGNSVIIGTERADWDQQIFRKDLWLWRANQEHDSKNESAKSGSLIQLTQSGHDTEPKWSPDGQWIAFLSERKSAAEKSADPDSSDADDEGDAKDKHKADKDEEGATQVYLISPNGGEAFAVTQGAEDVHAFAWSADSQTIYFATRQPWTKTQKDDYKKDWKDVVQYRTAERGDTIFELNVTDALARHVTAPAKDSTNDDDHKEPDLTPGAHAIATTPLRVDAMLVSPDGSKLAFLTNAINQRQEKVDDVELYLINVARAPSPANAGASPDSNLVQPRRITHNNAVEINPRWASDSRHIFFSVEVGDVTGPYRDLQPHLYWVDTEKLDTEKPDSDSGTVEQWDKDFIGPVEHYATAGASVLASARIGTEVQMYSASKPHDSLHRLSNWPGTYAEISTATHSSKIAFLYSALNKPEEIYFAESADKLNDARPITSFNKQLADADLPQGKPYQWKADDGTTVEGMLIYPPDKFGEKHLPMLTFIHGGPADADGNHFEADWYQWGALAATNGWLVFEPNYRGSTGYGDKFLMQIVPQIVSRPGKDILEGVDALVKDGIADPDRLTIGGYSYGGYMTNWLITQSTRWKAAVTGAGAVEHIGNWGNDDTTYDDAYFLGGRPWEAPQRYHDEAAIFQIEKVKTPTHMVAGADDIRVAVLEDYLLEHALYSLGIPNALLIFPGEGHSLSKNPWHGKIKVREELKWLEKYGGVPASN